MLVVRENLEKTPFLLATNGKQSFIKGNIQKMDPPTLYQRGTHLDPEFSEALGAKKWVTRLNPQNLYWIITQSQIFTG